MFCFSSGATTRAVFVVIRLLFIHLSNVLGNQMEIQLPGRLDGSVYMTMDSIGPIQCGKQCVVRTKCLSVNYQRHSLICQFNTNSDKTSLIQDLTWIYLDKTDLSQLYENRTCSGECPPNRMCITLSSHQITCVLTECIDPPSVPYATVSQKNVGISQDSVYTCNTNYYRTGQGDGKLTCLADGTFTDIDFVCELKPCTTPGGVPNADLTTYQLPVGEQAIYTCHYGYYLTSEPASITCLLGGTWSSPQFSCNEIPCSVPSAVSHSSVTSGYGTSVGSMATYTCNYGYSMSGTNTRTCQLGGSWSGVSFSCNEIPCPSSPPSVSHGSVTSINTHVGGRAYYDCDFGYGTSQDKSVVCQLGGHWSGVAFECKLLGLFG
ncbi:complement decay-accelerating factor-like [Argopecten irradians]|uniref:complement decay-accelerating factor-like n=1 Tax=Argopecten irradians TaxID=31199 RepID=UPI00371310EF